MSIAEERVYSPMENLSSGYEDFVLESVVFWSAKSTSTPHWRTAYRFSDDLEFNDKAEVPGISVDMFQPAKHVYHVGAGNNIFGSLVIRPVPKLVSTHVTIKCSYAIKKRVTVMDLVQLIKTNGLQYYKFNDELGSGCMFYQLTLLEKLEEHGWIERGSKKDALSSIAKCREEGNYNLPYPPVEGTFYTLDQNV